LASIQAVTAIKIVERARNKGYYRVLHVPIWIFVFFVLPGHLTFALYDRGFDARHGCWLAIVSLFCAWRGHLGRLPGVEPQPYITHYGVHQPNLGYRVMCYTAAWIALLVPYTLNLLGLLYAAVTGMWTIADLYRWLYYPLAAGVVLAAVLDWVPRARRSTANEGAERAWFYVAIWTVVPSQLVGWAVWRLGSRIDFAGLALARFRLAAFVAVSIFFIWMGLKGYLGRTTRCYIAKRECPPEMARNPRTGDLNRAA
jgi:hypothetical protein